MADLSITDSDVIPSATGLKNKRVLVAAETIEAGESLYEDSAGKAALTDASDSAKIGFIGIAVSNAVTGQPVVYVGADDNLAVTAAAVTNGAPIWLSETPGKLTSTQGDIATTGATHVLIGCGVGTDGISYDATASRSGEEIV